MANMQTYEDYLRGQVEKGCYGVAIVQAQIALDIARYIEKHRHSTIEPERKKGKWIPIGEIDRDGNQYYNCSVCQCGETHVPSVKVNYCWNCGAKMEEGGQ